MKNLCIFTSILLVLWFAGCGGNDDDDNDDVITPDGSSYGGFLSMTPGSWSDYSDDEGNRTRYEYIGIDTYNGIECFVMEFETTMEDEKMVSQIWIDKASGEGKLFVIKQDGEVMKMSIGQTPDVPGEEAEPENDTTQALGVRDYTTPTGKKVTANAYKDGTYEYWVSSEVPFGEVKSIESGITLVQLYDFGFSGAVRDISREEAMNAQSIEFPDFLP